MQSNKKLRYPPFKLFEKVDPALYMQNPEFDLSFLQ